MPGGRLGDAVKAMHEAHGLSVGWLQCPVETGGAIRSGTPAGLDLSCRSSRIRRTWAWPANRATWKQGWASGGPVFFSFQLPMSSPRAGISCSPTRPERKAARAFPITVLAALGGWRRTCSHSGQTAPIGLALKYFTSIDACARLGQWLSHYEYAGHLHHSMSLNHVDSAFRF